MISTLKPLIKQFMPFAQKRMGFNKPARVLFKDDPENASNPLGRTAYYDPESMSITLYTTNRHPKDIMRSLSHELVHHTQNCNGEFEHVGEMGEGYAQNDEHLREMERQAYEQGNLCFRDWEDSIKGTIYIQNMNVNIQKEGKNKMSTKDWKNNELSTLLTEKWGFSFNLLTESQDEEVVEEAKEEIDCKTLPGQEPDTSKADPNDWTVWDDWRAWEKKMERCKEQGLLEAQKEDLYEEGEELEEGGAAARTGNEEKDQGRERMHADRIHEDQESMTEAKVRQLIRQLIKEATTKKENK